MNQELTDAIEELRKTREAELAKLDNHQRETAELDRYNRFSTIQSVKEAMNIIERIIEPFKPELLRILEEFDREHLSGDMFEPWKDVFVNPHGEIVGQITQGGFVLRNDPLEQELVKAFKVEASRILDIDPAYIFASLSSSCCVAGMRRRH